MPLAGMRVVIGSIPRPLLAAMLAALLVLGYGAYTAARSTGSTSKGFTYPEELPGGYTIAAVLTGEKAVEASAGIHWNPTLVGGAIRDAAIIVYTDGTRLWLSYTGDNACTLAERMAEKIREHSTQLPYTPPVEHVFHGVKLYFTAKQTPDGATQLHVFWCRDGVVAWAEIGRAGAGMQNLTRLLETLVEEVGYNP